MCRPAIAYNCFFLKGDWYKINIDHNVIETPVSYGYLAVRRLYSFILKFIHGTWNLNVVLKLSKRKCGSCLLDKNWDIRS